MRRRIATVLYIALMFSVIAIAPANAYIDPGSGSIIFQALAGTAMALGLAGKVFWRRIAAFFSRKKETPEEPEQV